jgi:hypothetical protein
MPIPGRKARGVGENKTSNVRINVTLRRFHEIIVAEEKQ